jgi:hypothetical protein
MLPPFLPCGCAGDGSFSRRQHQERKLRMLRFWRDGLERQLAATDAAIITLERQMERDAGAAAGGSPA